MIENFISLLRQSDVHLDARELADLLWLGRVLPRHKSETDSITLPDVELPEPPTNTAPPPASIGDSASPPPPLPSQTTAPSVSAKSDPSLYVSGMDVGKQGLPASQIRVPGATALPDALAISRALRPFARRYRAGRRLVLDEEATVQRTAETRFLHPVFRPAPERWFEVALVVEDVPSMTIWQQTIREFRLLLERQGAFRDVRLWHLQFQAGRFHVREAAGVQRGPEALLHPAGRRLVMLLSDCSSRQWRDGTMARLVRQQAECMPVVMVHLLSENLWRNTAPGVPGARVKALLPGQSNTQLTVELPWWAQTDDGAYVPLPLVALNSEHLAEWARMVMTPGVSYDRAVLFAAHAEVPEAAPPPVDEKLLPAQRVQRFRALVSPEAFDLAVYLSVMPLTLPVMRLVQSAMLARPRQEQLAELLLGGILRRQTPADVHCPADEVVYEFHDGVREQLERAIFRSELDRVFRCVSQFIERRIGTPFDFIALLENPAGAAAVSDTVQPFATIARAALQRLGVSYETQASTTTTTTAPGSETTSATAPEQPAASSLRDNPTMLRDALTGRLPKELNQPVLDEVRAMLPRTALQLADAAGIFVSDDTIMISPQPEMEDNAGYGENYGNYYGGIPPQPEMGDNAELAGALNELLMEAVRRVSPMVLQNPESLPDYEGSPEEIAELTRRVKEAAGGEYGGFIVLSGGDLTSRALAVMKQVGNEFPDGMLFVDVKGNTDDQVARAEVFRRCIRPFIPLRDVPDEDDLSVSAEFLGITATHRLLIALVNVSDAGDFTYLQNPGRSVVLVGALPAGKSPDPSLTPEDHIRELARKYEQIRAVMPSGNERTRRMGQVVMEMKELIPEIHSLLPSLVRSNSPGLRLAAIAILAERPDTDYLYWLAERLRPAAEEQSAEGEKPFVGYHAALALLSAARQPAPADYERIRDAIRTARRNLGPGHEGTDRARTLDEAEAALPSSLSSPLTLSVFDFETVTLDEHGKVRERRRLQARQLIEQLVEQLAAGITLEMVEIPGGTFLMGAPESEAESWDNERPQHKVSVSPFLLGRYAVTQAQWREVAGWPKSNPDAPELDRNPSHFKGNDHPVENIAWIEAAEFCTRLTQKTGRAYRLPTEAEWEYACRAGTTTPFAFGETITPEYVNYNGNSPYGRASKGKYRAETVPVGSLGVANAFGLSDMHGNVYEWCQDWYSESYYEECHRQGIVNDPQGPTSGNYRVVRGGSWNFNGSFCRSASRYTFRPGDRNLSVGFRIVLPAPLLQSGYNQAA